MQNTAHNPIARGGSSVRTPIEALRLAASGRGVFSFSERRHSMFAFWLVVVAAGLLLTIAHTADTHEHRGRFTFDEDGGDE